MNIVLLQPEIPPNTGNVARLCAATRTVLHLVEPLGFKLDNTQLKRAGMDYWEHLEWRRWKNWGDFMASCGNGPGRIWLIESGGPKNYAEVRYEAGDYLVFGRETAGLPGPLLVEHQESWLRIPMFHDQCRSLNLANCASLVLYEALRQQSFYGESLS